MGKKSRQKMTDLNWAGRVERADKQRKEEKERQQRQRQELLRQRLEGIQ